MGKGDGSGEGWGEGEGQGTGAGMGAAEWKHGLFGCASDGGNRKNSIRSKLIKNFRGWDSLKKCQLY